MKHPLLPTIHVIALLVGMALLAVQAYSVRHIRHDDGISYLAATGHQGDYATSIPQNEWVWAKQWQGFWTPDQFWCFVQIARDLASYDIHPPFYFWLLHVWTYLYGVTLAAGPLLNIPFHLISCLAITASCRLLGCSRFVSVATGLLWLFSGANLAVASEVRQYSLLGAISSLFVLSLLRLLRHPTMFPALCLFLTSAMGMLTHYHFILLLGACGSLAAIQALTTKQWRTFFVVGICIALAALVFFLVHPTFYLSFQRQAIQAEPFAWTEVPHRFWRVLRTLIEQFVPHPLAQRSVDILSHFWLPVLILMLACMAGVSMEFIRSRSRRISTGQIARLDYIPFFGGFACLAVIGLLYISCRSPSHAMGAKYLMLVTPLLFIAFGQAIAWLSRFCDTWAVVMVVCLLGIQVTYGVLTTERALAHARAPHVNPLRDDAPLILDSTARGVLPTVLWHADPAMPVFAAPQTSLLTNGLPELPTYGFVVTTNVPRRGDVD